MENMIYWGFLYKIVKKLPKNVKFLPKYFFVWRKSSNFVTEIVKQTVKID